MRTIGVHPQDNLYYEGQGIHGRPLLPAPTLLIATALSGPVDTAQIPDTEDLGLVQLVFREDSFDAVTRLRRGRFYERGNASQPHQWYVEAHPHVWADSHTLYRPDAIPKQLHGFKAWPASLHLKTSIQPSLVSLGPKSAYSIWRVIEIERIITGEDLVTLKARGSMGVLPELLAANVPSDALPRVVEVLDGLVSSAHTAGPGSVVDRARDAAQWCIGVYMAAQTGDMKWRLVDLGHLPKQLPEELSVLRSIAQVVARLHSRGKPNEQARRDVRAPTEGDAEFALAAVGLMLREVGWAA